MIYHKSWSYKPTYKFPKAPWKCGYFRRPGCLPASPCRRSRSHRCHLRRRRGPGMKDAVTAPWTKNPAMACWWLGKCFYYTRSLGPLQTWNSMWDLFSPTAGGEVKVLCYDDARAVSGLTWQDTSEASVKSWLEPRVGSCTFHLVSSLLPSGYLT